VSSDWWEGNLEVSSCLSLRVEDLALGAEPVLFIVAGFTATVFIKFIGLRSNHLL
jgi:hypothetical protein